MTSWNYDMKAAPRHEAILFWVNGIDPIAVRYHLETFFEPPKPFWVDTYNGEDVPYPIAWALITPPEKE